MQTSPAGCFRLKVEETIHISRTFGGKEEIPGLKDISGVISVTTGHENLSDGSVLTLHLSDGRRWDFFAKSGNPVSGEYSVVNSSGQGFVRP